MVVVKNRLDGVDGFKGPSRAAPTLCWSLQVDEDGGQPLADLGLRGSLGGAVGVPAGAILSTQSVINHLATRNKNYSPSLVVYTPKCSLIAL